MEMKQYVYMLFLLNLPFTVYVAYYGGYYKCTPSTRQLSKTPSTRGNVPKTDILSPSSVKAPADVKWASDTVNKYVDGFTNLTDPGFISYLSSRWILQPSTSPVHLSNPQRTDASEYGQSAFVDEILHQHRGGFYVECGAADGEALSNTLFFDTKRGWSGLLIEANPYYFHNLLKTNRHAYLVNSCLSTENKTGKLEFTLDKLSSGLNPNGVSSNRKTLIQCFPLFPLLQAIGQTRIDYFSLDVEGAELPILRTIPWRKLYIDVVGIEYRVFRGTMAQHNARLEETRAFFRSLNGMYKEVGIIPKTGLGLDVFFQHT